MDGGSDTNNRVFSVYRLQALASPRLRCVERQEVGTHDATVFL